MGALDAAFGSGMIGTWVASILYGIAVGQAFEYHANFPNDGLMRKGLVLSSLVIAAAALASDYADVYLSTVTFWGQPSALMTESWPEYANPILNTAVGTLVNSYLVSRFYTLSKNIYVTIILYLFILLSFVASFTDTLVVPFHSISDLQKAEKFGYLWIISTATTDLSIVVALLWTLHRMKSKFKDTNTLIHRVMLTSLQNGGANTLASLSGLVALLIKDGNNVPTLFFFLLGPLYVLTLLSNFNLRQNSKSGTRTLSTGSRGNTNILVDGIHVRRTAIVTVDGSESEMEMARRKDEEGSISKQHRDVEAYGAEQVKVSNLN
ncbi:hypothetical protein B0H11DRAFT_780408 [Mycena galericulata]|nr:hypothetical protein B0H11DRAFT_932785 [Mycena galericulata]KAJ7500369.1 hypothetical protein B0H11DRAFT_780408 [Mycena galericulata]